MVAIVDAGVIPLLVKALSEGSAKVQAEASRAIGNLSANLDYGSMIMKHDVLPHLLMVLKKNSFESQRMAAMALANLASNIKNQTQIVELNIFDILVAEFCASLDPKCESDHECNRFFLLLVANLSANNQNHDLIIERIQKSN